MDVFDEALESVGVSTEKISETHSKIGEEVQGTDIKVNEQRNNVTESQSLFCCITAKDRDQAVYEKIIPQGYKDAYFDIDKIKRNIRAQYIKTGKLYKVYKFDEYANVCQEILSTIRMGMLPQRSYLIGAPNGFGKSSFVNECLITLRKRGYRTAPYISLWELAQIRVDNEHRIMEPYRKFKKEGENVIYSDPNTVVGYVKVPTIVTTGFSYSEYINADCLFVSLTDVISKDIESHTLYQLLAIRGAKGLPTIVTMSTSLDCYENDKSLKELVWDEIKNYDDSIICYDRVLHVSCYKRKSFGLDTKNEDVDVDTGIVH